MKKLQSSLKNMLLVLTGVTAVSVALLAYVNELTKGPIAEANAKTLNEALKKVLPEFTNNPVAESDTIFSEKDGKKNVISLFIRLRTVIIWWVRLLKPSPWDSAAS